MVCHDTRLTRQLVLDWADNEYAWDSSQVIVLVVVGIVASGASHGWQVTGAKLLLNLSECQFCVDDLH